MPTIGDLGYGTSESGVGELLKEIESHLIKDVSTNAGTINEIVDACENNWSGVSKDRFIENLKDDVELLQKSLMDMYNSLEKEIKAASYAIIDFDRNLIER